MLLQVVLIITKGAVINSFIKTNLQKLVYINQSSCLMHSRDVAVDMIDIRFGLWKRRIQDTSEHTGVGMTKKDKYGPNLGQSRICLAPRCDTE